MNSKNEDAIQDLFEEASAAIDVGRLEKGEELLREVLEEEPDHAGALNKMGVIHALRKEKDRAREYFEESLNADRRNAPALTNLANIYLEKEEHHQAESMYNEALTYDPEYGPAHNNLAAIYKKKGEYGKMVSSLKKARKAGTISVDHSEKSIFLNPGGLLFLGLIIMGILLIFLLQ